MGSLFFGEPPSLPFPILVQNSVQLFHLMLNNREIATLVWVAAAIPWAFSNKSVRGSFAQVVKMFLEPRILTPFVVMLAWIGLELWVGIRLAFWNPALAKGTILWTLGSASVLLVNCTQIDSDGDHLLFFRRTLLATVCVTAFVEFFASLYVMNLPAELVFQIMVVVLSLVVVVAGKNPKYKSVKVFCERMLALICLAFITMAAQQIYLNWQQLDAWELLLDFALPVWLTVGLVPFLYFFSIYVVYDAAFCRIHAEATGIRARWRSQLALLSVLHFRAHTVQTFTRYPGFVRKLGESRTFSTARDVLAEFLDRVGSTKRAKLEEEERLRRYSGSQGLDDEGKQLDQREFRETICALQWLATCQMGWYRNDDHYRRDLLKVLDDDFTRYGLPRKSGIELHVSLDGQSWYAWRRTVTGWCFAIGAATTPPDQWKYDGPEPPKEFPTEDSTWGDGPFTMNRINRNWW